MLQLELGPILLEGCVPRFGCVDVPDEIPSDVDEIVSVMFDNPPIADRVRFIEQERRMSRFGFIFGPHPHQLQVEPFVL